MAQWCCGFVLESGEPCGSFAEADNLCDTHTVMNTIAQWRCRFALESGQPCGEAATYGGFCDAHMIIAAAAETCLCGAPALGEAALADDMYTAHPTLCAACAASDNLMACGNCGRLGTEDVVAQHNTDAHYTTRPLGTTVSAEAVTQCLDSLPSDARPVCTICDQVLVSYDDMRRHARDNHLKGIRRETGSDELLTQCEVHDYNREGTYRGGFCRLCIRRHPRTLQWVCEPCGRVEIGPEGPAHHFAECHRDLTHDLVTQFSWDLVCRVCGYKWVPRKPFINPGDGWLEDHFIAAHVANLACPLEGCRHMPRSPWAGGALRRHIIHDHTRQAPQPIIGYRDSVPLSVPNGFAKARNARLGSDTPTTSAVRRRMLCSAAWPVEHSRRFSPLNRAFLLADYMLALGPPGPLLRELCWDSTRPPTDIDELEDVVVARFRAVTDPRCIPVDSHKSYANLPADMWGVIMAQLPYRDALALGQTCRRLWAVYGDVWRGPTDTLLAWLRILLTDIHRMGQCDACGMRDAEAYFVLTVIEIMRALGHNSKDHYSVRGLAHTAIIKYGSVEAFKKAYVEKLAEDFFTDSSGPDSISDDDDDWEGEEDGEAASGGGSGNDQGEGVSDSESE